MELFILKKQVDWSLLTYGFNIPVEFQLLVHESTGGYLAPGKQRKIKLLIDGVLYNATLCNIGFDRGKYSNHKDLLQVRYSSGSEIAKALRNMFYESFSYLKDAKDKLIDKRKILRLPESINEYMTLYSTLDTSIFRIECFSSVENNKISESVYRLTEEEYEMSTNYLIDNTTTGYVERIRKVRLLDASIAESLKKIYDYRCQITGEKIGSKYGNSVIEAHHIEYFTKSLNNNSSNLILVNPTFHRIIHQNNPVFNWSTLSFEFQNGVVEKVKLDKHLHIK